MSCPSVRIGPYVVEEIPAPLVYTFLDSAGSAMDLTGYTAVFGYRERDGSAAVGTATVTGPAAGEVTHTWTGAEFPTPGSYQAEFTVDNGVNRFVSLLIVFEVRGRVAP